MPSYPSPPKVSGDGAEPRPGARPARFMVLVDGSAASAHLVRETHRLASALGAPWIAVHLHVAERMLYSPEDERRLSANLMFAERLGADLVALHRTSVRLGRDLLALAASREVTDVVLGLPARPRWANRLRGSLLEDLARGGLGLSIHVVPPRSGRRARTPPPGEEARAWSPDLRQGFGALILVVLATGVGYLVFELLGLADVMIVYMLCIAVAATRFERWAAALTSVLAVLALDFCFIDPRYTFVLTDMKHIGTFAVMVGVGWVILGLTEALRAQTLTAEDRERHARTLYRAGAVLAEGGSLEAIRQRAEAFLGRELDCPAAILLCDAQGRLPDPPASAAWADLPLARAALELRSPAGRGTGFRSDAACLFLPMLGSERVLGVLGAAPASRESGRLDLLVPLASQLSMALERAALAEERTEARIRAEHESLRSTLLSSVSHDLRTPLGTITGATSTLLDPGPESSPEDHQVLLNTIHQEARRLLRMVTNLLDITKLESGQVKVRKEWAAIEEVVGSAIAHLEDQVGSRPLEVDLPETWVPMDPVLFEQAMVNILENALKFSPPGSKISIRGWVEGREFRIQVEDQGPGIPPGEERLVFEKLYRGSLAASKPGAGLGLAICRGIIQAHGGAISASTAPGGGARILVALPLETSALAAPPPEINPETVP